MLETDCGPLFRCTTFLDENEGLAVDGTSMTSAAQLLIQAVRGDIRVNGPSFCGLRNSILAKYKLGLNITPATLCYVAMYDFSVHG